MKLDWSWQQVTVFVVVLLVCGALVFSGKAHAEILGTALGLLVPAGPTRSRESTPPPTGGP